MELTETLPGFLSPKCSEWLPTSYLCFLRVFLISKFLLGVQNCAKLKDPDTLLN
ncbi:mCG148060 [Mus musculus]|nr:mCG148060 [Mus musculus]